MGVFSGRPPNPEPLVITRHFSSSKLSTVLGFLFYNRVKLRVYLRKTLLMVETNHYYKEKKGSVELLTK